jgi:hypothetical protein
MVSIESIKFVGLIGDRPWKEITVNEFMTALGKNGWKEAHNAHIFMRLSEKGAALGIRTPNEFARALRSGTTEEAKDGAQARVCSGGKFQVIFRDNCFITLRYP